MEFQIRQTRAGDVSGVVALQRECFPYPFDENLLWKAEHIDRHMQIFPKGQFVAVLGSQVVGSATSLIITEENWNAHHDWETTVGGHYLNRHDPSGTTLYAVDISVSPGARGLGIGRMLYEARKDLVRELGLKRIGTACRIPDCMGWQLLSGGSAEEFVELVRQEELKDRTLTPLLKMGMRLLGVQNDYMEDEESGNAAAILEWTP